ncbi:MAG TPA: SigE family RNA polymerase sigma factor [Kineosporiaceae bacterium]|nr:SigE family RNA polymerase sigma factor [Kineosporiaceae bacterium]
MLSSSVVIERERLSPAAEPEYASSGSRGAGGLSVLGDRPSGRSNPDESAQREALFEAFVERNSRELGRLAYLMVGDRDAADDLTADALLAAWRQWDTVRASDYPLAYVRRVVINMAATRIRRMVRERRWLVMFQNEAMEVAPGTDSAAVVDVRTALLRLPAGRRACVVLRYAFDLSEQEVAALLGVSVGTVKSQTSKGAEQLRRRLGAPDEAISGSLTDPVPRGVQKQGSGLEGRKDGRE